MKRFLLFFRRDMRQIFINPRLLILPLAFFFTSLFLINFTSTQNLTSLNTSSLYWVIFFLSTTGVLGQNIAKDYDIGFLQTLQAEKTSLHSYIFSKGLSLTIGWSISFWMFWIYLQFLTHSHLSFFIFFDLIAITFVSGTLGFLYCFLDALFLHGKKSSLLGFILITPFMLPLLILCLSSFENNPQQTSVISLLPIITYATFLVLGSALLTQRSLTMGSQ